MKLKELSADEKIAHLIKPILKVLQKAGGQLERSEIKERIAETDEDIAEYAELEKKSKITLDNALVIFPISFLVIFIIYLINT